MICTKLDLKECLLKDLTLYGENSRFLWFKHRLFHGSLTISRYISILRRTEYYHNNSYHKTGKLCNIFNDIIYIYYHRLYEGLGAKLGLEVGLNSCDSGLLIYHKGFVVVNYQAKIGKNARFHGCNCVGKSHTGVPVIGDNVEFGVGSSVIGGIQIANNVKIGAGAVVTKDILEEGVTVIGVPAHIIKKTK